MDNNFWVKPCYIPDTFNDTGNVFCDLYPESQETTAQVSPDAGKKQIGKLTFMDLLNILPPYLNI